MKSCLLVVLLVSVCGRAASFPSIFKHLVEEQEEARQKPDIRKMIELFNSMQKPSQTEKDPEKLMVLLGENYNPAYMSVSEPPAMKAREPSSFEIETEYDKNMRTMPDMSEELTNMKFVVKKNGKRKEYGQKLTQKLQNFLYNLSKCSVKYKWIDLGVNVFPRFIKRGSCTKKKTCSYPAGMKCQESKWQDIEVLLYTCITDSNSVGTDCQWRPLKLDALVECTCGCNAQ